jgi:hypothetical protein
MGATVSTAKLATAFQTAGNETIYVLYEQTYEKNCYPHTPHWGCRTVGPLATVMKWIFSSAAACEGGMLQVRGGRNKPEQYIADWLTQLATPKEQHDVPFTLVVGDWNSSIPNDKSKDVLAQLSAAGFETIALALAAGEKHAGSLWADSRLVTCLYGEGDLAPWRIMRHSLFLNTDRPDLGYLPVPVKKPTLPPPPAFLKVDGDNRLVRQKDGSWRCEGWEYSVIGSFVASLWSDELAQPGTFRKRIKACREAMQAAPMVPMDMKVLVDLTVPHHSAYDAQEKDEIARHFPVKPTATGYEISLRREPRDLIDLATENRELYRITRLASQCATWVGEAPQAQPA